MGFVLAGGRSSRMGRDKALLPFRGGALVECVAHTVGEAAGAVMLVGNPELYAPLGFLVIPDLYPGEGPLGGILTALAHSSAAWNLVAACDMPGLTLEVLRDLFDRATTTEADIVLPAGPSGCPEPLCAIYHIRSLPALQRAFAGGTRKITAAIEGLRTLSVSVPEAAVFHNVNTPEDWADYAGY
jgi:molybdopterin-guanine dinucleotide biosynthesis protein A